MWSRFLPSHRFLSQDPLDLSTVSRVALINLENDPPLSIHQSQLIPPLLLKLPSNAVIDVYAPANHLLFYRSHIGHSVNFHPLKQGWKGWFVKDIEPGYDMVCYASDLITLAGQRLLQKLQGQHVIGFCENPSINIPIPIKWPCTYEKGYQGVMSALGLDEEESLSHPPLLTEVESSFADETLSFLTGKPVIGINYRHSHGQTMGDYPLARLASKLFARKHCDILLLASEEDTGQLQPLVHGLQGLGIPIVMSVTGNSLEGSLALIDRMAALITCSPTTSYLAEFCGVPSFNIYTGHPRFYPLLENRRRQFNCFSDDLGELPLELLWDFLDYWIENDQPKTTTLEFESIALRDLPSSGFSKS